MASSQQPTFPSVSTYKYSNNDPSNCFPVENPATGQIITTIQAGDASTVDKAVRASQDAFLSWRELSPTERSQYLFRCAAELEKHAEDIATLLTLENGKPLADAKAGDVFFLVNIFRFFGSLVDKMPSQFYDRGVTTATVYHEPFGVCAGILPFNWPPIHCGGKVAPCIAMGNTMILKPGEQAPLTVMKIVEILQGVLPPNVVQVVPGLGVEVPQALVDHPLVKMVSFTGSTAAGAKTAETAARSITKTVLELGGKNAMIVFDDADLEDAVRTAIAGAFFNKGEACTATSRFIVQDGVYDEFVSALAKGVEKLKVGNGMDPGVHVGPQVSKAQQKRVLDYIELGKQEGAKVVAHASLPSDPDCKEGFFVPPTLFADVTGSMRIFQEEMFGPVATITPFATPTSAITLTNSVPYGLTCSIYTQNSVLANRTARSIDAGMVFLNNYHRMAIGVPFGGMKHSGYGREHCVETLYEWSQPKTVHAVSGRGEVPAWRAVGDVFGEGKPVS
ncbi:hypothetical protein M409DRAFT_55757 [Zasmidium cellare ATCC 36951]|uniref:aldehyde dehydrogenase (NAD(+)) n=1 Tax=Zasmidium cellare ATCC 36951 TaxID=1080233 RepID=A0A6A6CFC2_ZASCE|nr:uncharacterized protein M409DRAFT_55757 [Zasmidium cellare ATCC 36951]KAF2165343.1 hypothetical protein M409DRAFT_55757 [Zasmidium cellare ATCC 36951]